MALIKDSSRQGNTSLGINDGIFIGVVISSTSSTYTVTVARESWGSARGMDIGHNMQAAVVSSVMTSFLGFSDCTVPQPGSRVVCIQDSGGKAYILGVLPNPSVNTDALPSRAMLGAGHPREDAANCIGHQTQLNSIYDLRRPSDVVDGEYVVANEFGVLLGLYQHLANLKASELAQIQCHLLDDLVRVISHNYQHYSAIGECNIWHDGKRLMAEYGATHKIGEAYGQPAVDSDETPPTFSYTGSASADDSEDFYKIEEDERLRAIERLKLFIGSVGDLAHLLVVRPQADKTRPLDGSIDSPDLGVADVHIGSDGGMHLRSIKEVFIEKTNWIRVPLRKRYPDDPEGDDAETLAYEKKEKFKFNDTYKYKDNPFSYALQIRDYVAYKNEKLGYQNFKKHEKDFYVNDELEQEEVAKDKVDQETDLHLQDYKLRTAGIYLMPNGGITIRDAWNSAIVMEGGNIYFQAAKDQVFQPLRNSVTKAGGHINMSAKKDIDFSSTEEGLRLKANKAAYIYSHESGVVIEANGESDTPGVGSDSEEALEYIGGVVIKSKLGIYNYAEKNILSYAKENLLLHSLLNLDLISDKMATLHGKEQLFLLSAGQVNLYAEDQIIAVAEGSAVFAGAASTALGQEDQNLGVKYDEKSMFIDIIKGILPVSEITEELAKVKEAKQEVLNQTIFGEESTFEDLKFRYLSTDKYGALSSMEDAIPMTIAQQDTLTSSLYNDLEPWKEKEINSSLPFPGKSLFDSFYLSSDAVKNLNKDPFSDSLYSKADSDVDPAEIKLDSLMEYKVQT